MPATSTPVPSVQVLDFEINSLLFLYTITSYVLSVRRASALPAASFSQNLTVLNLAVRLILPPAGRTNKKPANLVGVRVN
jgi:hypothetical protein